MGNVNDLWHFREEDSTLNLDTQALWGRVIREMRELEEENRLEMVVKWLRDKGYVVKEPKGDRTFADE